MRCSLLSSDCLLRNVYSVSGIHSILSLRLTIHESGLPYLLPLPPIQWEDTDQANAGLSNLR